MSEEQKRMLNSLKQTLINDVNAGIITRDKANSIHRTLQSKNGKQIEETYNSFQSYDNVRDERIATITDYLHEFVLDGTITSDDADSIYKNAFTRDNKDLLDIIVDMNKYQEIPYSLLPGDDASYEKKGGMSHRSNR